MLPIAQRPVVVAQAGHSPAPGARAAKTSPRVRAVPDGADVIGKAAQAAQPAFIKPSNAKGSSDHLPVKPELATAPSVKHPGANTENGSGNALSVKQQPVKQATYRRPEGVEFQKFPLTSWQTFAPLVKTRVPAESKPSPRPSLSKFHENLPISIVHTAANGKKTIEADLGSEHSDFKAMARPSAKPVGPATALGTVILQLAHMKASLTSNLAAAGVLKVASADRSPSTAKAAAQYAKSGTAVEKGMGSMSPASQRNIQSAFADAMRPLDHDVKSA